MHKRCYSCLVSLFIGKSHQFTPLLAHPATPDLQCNNKAVAYKEHRKLLGN